MNNADVLKQRRGRILRYAPLIVWIIVIFVFSSSTGSMSNTSRIIRPILEFLFPTAAETELAAIHGYIRKSAHFGVYFVLGVLAARAFYFSSQKTLETFWFVAAFVLVVAVASVDETNQSFLASRTGSVYDVVIDAAGGATALILFHVIFIAFKKRV